MLGFQFKLITSIIVEDRFKGVSGKENQLDS